MSYFETLNAANLLNPHPVSITSVPPHEVSNILNPHPVSVTSVPPHEVSNILNPHPVSITSVPPHEVSNILNPHPVSVTFIPAHDIVIKDDAGNRAQVDSAGYLEMIDIVHHKIHAGYYFGAGYIYTGVAAAASKYLVVSTGSDTLAHITFEVSTSGKAIFYLYENPTLSLTGTELSKTNFNRGSFNTSGTHIYHTPTVTSNGSLLGCKLIPGSSGGGARIGSSVSAREEFLLASGTNYLLCVENTSGVSIDIGFDVEWYEVVTNPAVMDGLDEVFDGADLVVDY